MSRPSDSLHIIQEFDSKHIDYILIIDSNVNSKGYLYPVPGNDDSILCLNFYCFFFALLIIKTKIIHFNRFKDEIYDKAEFNTLTFSNKLLNLYLFKNQSYNLFDINNTIIKSLFKVINNNFTYFNWMTNTSEHSLLNVQVHVSVLTSLNLDFLRVHNIVNHYNVDYSEEKIKYPNAFDPFLVL
jgi:hypothetical protein